MYAHRTSIRVRYAETDRMGYVYYGRYAEFFEVGRVEAMRSLGFPYRALEERGFQLPVHDLQVTYHRPARYDDALVLATTITEPPSVRITFRYELFDAGGVLLTEGSTTLVFIDAASGRPRRAPDDLVAALRPHFS
jgi:acyl-CoA thioester hydrolase